MLLRGSNEKVPDLAGDLRGEEGNDVLEMSLLRRNVSCTKLRLDLKKPYHGVGWLEWR